MQIYDCTGTRYWYDVVISTIVYWDEVLQNLRGTRRYTRTS